MVTVEVFSRLVSGIYDAAVAQQHWQSAIRDIHQTIGGAGGSLLWGGGGTWLFQNSTLPVEALENYSQHYAPLDYVLAGVRNGPVGVVRTGPEIVIPNRNREFYADWMRPNGLEDGLFVRLTDGTQPACFLVISPTRSFDTPERVDLMRALVPHLRQALRTQDKVAALANQAVEMAGALEAVRHGLVVVAGEGVVVNVNSTAERVLRSEDGLCLRSGRIAATSPHADQALHRAIRDALVADRCTVRSARSLTCGRPSGRRPYVVHVLPSYRRNADEPIRQPMALVVVVDPESEPLPAAGLLRRLYHLTEAEAAIAVRLAGGADVRQISEELSISLTTVRTHLQHVFDKTGTHRQAELIRHLLALCP
ncbi:helix-turn-helix transcriptional regulator [Mycobacterium colombiense]|uniref:helix-turn-helix transcriptional regulator n=1 Tax=Mycobacterium colombiense TaxID=339268 RepID=UPI00096C090F|nr:helix-turn-helix transcriptional regulator [Mycobacterium colombiense]OMC30427.1 helix-turn-helix transcriptional regulator [Mycobacterium colombiense]